MASLADRIATLSPAQRAQFERRLLTRGRPAITPACAIVPSPAERYEPFPLTDVQQAYWVGRNALFALGNVASHVYVEAELPRLDLRRLEQAWRCLVARHDMLRAIIQPDGRQRILRDVPAYEIAVLDLRGCEPAVVHAELAAIRTRMSHEMRSTDQWPLFEIRASLLEGGLVRLHLSFDVLIADAWSFAILRRELFQMYEAPARQLPPLELTFRDYVLAVAASRSTPAYRRSLEYWSARAPSLPPAPELPLACQPETIASPRFVRRSGRLDPEAWQRINARARRRALTPSAVLLTAFADVLGAWSKNPRFTLNLTLFNRLPLHPQVNDVVGDFTSLNLLAVDAAGDTFARRASDLQARLFEDIDHHHVSGVEVLREIARARGDRLAARMPVVFTSALRSAAGAGNDAPGITMPGEVFAATQTPQVWLDHQVGEQDGGLWFHWDVVEELFPAGMIEDMFDAYRRTLARLLGDDACWEAASGPLVPDAHLVRRAEVNATAAPLASDALHAPFLGRQRRQPDRIAVVSEHERLTYGELAARATAVARMLPVRGQGHPVAIVMEKGWEQVVAALAVLGAGGAYLPIDPELPTERLHNLLRHGQSDFVLTQTRLQTRLPWPTGVQRLCVDAVPAAPPGEVHLDLPEGPDDLAYVIYTSGSTGMPKGVMISHRGAANTILDVNQRFRVGPIDRVLALSSLTFDLSVYDVFGLLAAGGTIVMPDTAGARDPGHWLELLAREGVTVWNSVPALMTMLVEYLAGRGARLPSSLRLVLLSGDWIPVGLPDRIRALGEGLEVVSLGGATEVSIWSVAYPIDAVDPAWSSIPYGKPLSNQTLHVLDEAGRPRPDWVPGQLHIGGLGVALGYWRDDEQTERHFATVATGERLYCTGDLARYLPDGNVEFLGRDDLQVKVQGYRIELAEIEAVLEKHSAVRSAAVVGVGGRHSDKRLVAHVALEPLDERDPGPDGVDRMADAVEHLQYKLDQPGVRRLDPETPALPLTGAAVDDALRDAYCLRRSHRRFVPDVLPFAAMSQLLGALRRIDVDGLPKYRYPSAGHLYPVQTYVAVKPGRVEGVRAGVYYYHPLDHGLRLLSPDACIDRSVHAAINRPVFDAAAFSVFMVGALDAITPVYGALAREFCLLEAGYMGQLLMTVVAGTGVGLCPVGWLDFEAIRPLFALRNSDVFLHGLVVGATGELAGRWSFVRPEPSREAVVAEQLRTFAAQKLPAYMVPSAYVLTDALPLTANGKVDRGALAAIEPAAATATVPFVPPERPVELQIAEAWRRVLAVERVGLHDNFFDLGGTSLQLMQLHTLLSETLAREIGVTTLFRFPNVGSLARHLAGTDDARVPATVRAARRGEGRKRLAERRGRRRGVGPLDGTTINRDDQR